MADSHDDHDLLQVGSHCEYSVCSRLDFLPFKCADCGLTFCLDHRLGPSHDCKPINTRLETASSTSILPEFHACDAIGCQQREHVRIECTKCRGNFCFAHRFAEDHKCPALSPAHSHQVESGRHVEFKLPDTLVPPIQPPKSRQPSSAMALKLNAMKLKMNAIGEPQIMEEHRWFLEIIFLDNTSKSVFVDNDWSFGRASDSIKRILKVNFAHEKARLRDATKLNVDIATDRPMKEVIPNGGTLQFVIE